MKTIGVTTALQTLLLSPTVQLTTGDCFTFNFLAGPTLNLCAFDRDILLNGVLYSSGLSKMPNSMGRIGFKQQRGFQGDDITVSIASFDATSPTVLGLPLKEAMIAGLFDGASVQVQRIFNPVILPSGVASVDATPYGSVIMFVGLVAESQVTQTGIPQLTLRTMLDLLQQQIPRAMYQPACQWTLFDAGCQLLNTNFELVGIQALSGSTASTILAGAMTVPNTGIPLAGQAMPDGWLDEGSVTFISGQNNGLTRSISSFIGAGNQHFYHVAVLDSQPLAYYTLGDSSGAVVDSSGNGYNGTLNGGVTRGVTGPLTGDTTTAYSFDGSTGWLSLPIPQPSTVSKTYGGFAIEFWIKPNNLVFQGLFDTAPGQAGTIRNANVAPSQYAYSAVEWNPDEPRVGLQATSTSAWTYVVINFYGNRFIDVYINGAYFTGGSDANPPNGPQYVWKSPIPIGKVLAPVTVGLGPVTQWYGGDLGQLAFYTYPLSIDTVQTHYLVGTTNPAIANPDSVITVFNAFPYAPAPGDRMNLLPGCDKAMPTCGLKFNNLPHFGGQPFIPQNTTAF